MQTGIISLIDRKTGIKYTEGIRLSKEKANGSLEPIWRIFLSSESQNQNQDRMLTKCSKFNVEYECQTCNRHNTITLPLFYRRLNHATKGCHTCSNQDIVKRETHSEWMKQLDKGQFKRDLVIAPKRSAREVIAFSEMSYDAMDSDFKDAYEAKYVLDEDYKRLRPHIVSFQHDKFPLINDIEYIPQVIVNNQFKFYPGLYHKPTDTLQKCCYIQFKCQVCESQFVSKTIEVHKNHHKILCQKCSFTNKIFKIRSAKNCKNATVTFQSKFELKLLNYCNDHDIELVNGPHVEYVWNLNRKETRKYRVAFFVPKLNLAVEMKDHHIWHKQDLANGKWQSKEAAAKEFCLQNNLTYIIVYPDTYMKFIKEIMTKNIVIKI